jgi:hypothetical protein
MLSTTEILERATREDGPLFSVREAMEAEAATEQAEAEAGAATARAEAEATLSEARTAYKAIRDRRWDYLLKLPKLQDDHRAALERYKAAQRRARALGVEEPEPLFDMVQTAVTGGALTYQERKQADEVTAAMRRGL